MTESRNRLSFLNGLRGLAAIYVLIHHSRWLLTEGYSYRMSSQVSMSVVEKWFLNFFAFFRFGHEMVIFFFVLSGFVIHFSTLNSIKKNELAQVNWWMFFKKRVNRIYPPFLFALLFTLLIDCIGKYYFHFSAYYKGTLYFSPFLNPERLSAGNFISNVFNLQYLWTDIFGSNQALWSLSYEWWFYMAFPLFYFIHRRSILAVVLIQISLFIISFITVTHDSYIPFLSLFFEKMIIWWMGVIMAEIYFGRIQVSFRYLTVLILAIPMAIIFYPKNWLLGDLLWGAGFSGVLGILFSIKESNVAIKILQKISFTGNFSYTLYLIHVPIIYLFHGYLIDKFNGKLPLSYTWFFAVSLGIVFFSAFIAKRLERISFFKTDNK